VICGAVVLFVQHMTPPSWMAGAANAHNYLVTQPYVALLYFKTFFWPSGLSADYDLNPFVTTVLHEQQHRSADHKYGDHLYDPGPNPPLCFVLREKEPKEGKENGEDRSRRFGQNGESGRERVKIISAQAREGEPGRKRSDHAERRDHFRRRDDVVDRVRVGRVQPVTGCDDERDPTVARRITRVIEQARNDKSQEQDERDEEREDGQVKPERSQALA
jgi:hypothetical protein